jgi:hypothetical protein
VLSEVARRFELSGHPDLAACRAELERRRALFMTDGGRLQALAETLSLALNRAVAKSLPGPAVEVIRYSSAMQETLERLDARMVAGGYLRPETN